MAFAFSIVGWDSSPRLHDSRIPPRGNRQSITSGLHVVAASDSSLQFPMGVRPNKLELLTEINYYNRVFFFLFLIVSSTTTSKLGNTMKEWGARCNASLQGLQRIHHSWQLSSNKIWANKIMILFAHSVVCVFHGFRLTEFWIKWPQPRRVLTFGDRFERHESSHTLTETSHCDPIGFDMSHASSSLRVV